jgi:hypothetical protein
MFSIQENTEAWKTQGSLPPLGYNGDLYFHVGGNVFVVHRHILRKKCPQLYHKIALLEKSRMYINSANQNTSFPFTVRLLDEKETCNANQTNREKKNGTKRQNENSTRIIQSRERIALQNIDGNLLQDLLNPSGAFEQEKRSLCVAKKPLKTRLDVEISCMDPQIFGVLLDFIYTDTIPHPINSPSKSQEMFQVCQWLGLGSTLLAQVCFEQIFLHDLTMENWFSRLVQISSSYKNTISRHMKESIIKRMMVFLQTHPMPEEQFTFFQLVAIQEEQIVLRVVSTFLQKLKNNFVSYSIEIQKNILKALSLWLTCTYHTSSLLELHLKFASWYPCIVLQDEKNTPSLIGMNAYIRPLTLFCFGKFEFQVRLQMVEEKKKKNDNDNDNDNADDPMADHTGTKQSGQ